VKCNSNGVDHASSCRFRLRDAGELGEGSADLRPLFRPAVWRRLSAAIAYGLAIALLTTVMTARAAGPVTAGERATGPDYAIVPAFERFAGDDKLSAVSGGLLLLGELNCTSCHKPTAAAEAALKRKTAPVLSDIGSRAQPEWIRRFIVDPQRVKPGTTMPDVLSALPDSERKATAESLVHFLASTGNILARNPDKKLIPAGQRLYHQVGCVACHGPRDATAPALATSMPLGDLSAKYSVPSLAAFLADPHKVRPSGRMPGLNLTAEETVQLASYLLETIQIASVEPNLNYAFYEGDWQKLPDFAALKSAATGKSTGFDCTVAPRSSQMALRFSGFLRIDAPGEYTFTTWSDDGSKLWIDGKPVVDNDGVHAPSAKSGQPVRLEKGMHEIVAGVFNAGGGVELDVEIEGAGLGRQTILPLLSLSSEAPKKPAAASGETAFLFDNDLAAKGREAFIRVGCASCHEMAKAKPPADELIAPPSLAELKPGRGCLADIVPPGAPRFALSKAERAALSAAVAALVKPAAGSPVSASPPPEQVVQQTLLAFNCYACHARGGLGGVEAERDAYFETQQKEMGDEGRLPPPLDGVGAKLTSNWLKHIFASGAKDRPYMLTRMPKFGEANLAALIAPLDALDTLEAAKPVTVGVTAQKFKAAGRLIAGDKGGLGCVKCHSFRDAASSGIQAMNMTLMPQRLKHDWFRRYVLNPQAFRSGTRMPAAWPNGQSFLRNLLDGTADTQIEAVWAFLSDGDKALIPLGLARSPIELEADKTAIIYRNFIEGAGPRAIGVAYPEKANLAFDANDLRIALLWQGGFIDASRHWVDRGAGYQPPLGDNILTLTKGSSFATLDSQNALWPKEPAKALGYRFRGYRLAKDDRPTFLYDLGPIHVEDFPDAVAGKENPSLRRTMTLKSAAPIAGLWYRAAAAPKIEAQADGWYDVGGAWKTRLESSAKPLLRESQGQTELLLPVEVGSGEFKIVQDYAW
jgi:mono/diheme cytochrome c family protein